MLPTFSRECHEIGSEPDSANRFALSNARAGGEDWYYSFSSSPEAQGSTYHDGQTDSVSVSVSVSNDKVDRPVHLSPEGYVIEPLPSGHVVR